MGSLSITPFSCTHQAIHKTEATMKVFATLATILGVAYATPEAQTHTVRHVGAMQSGHQQHNNVVGKSTESVLSNVRMASPYQAQAGPRQYHLQDEFGNFEYAYANQDSEKMEKGNDMLVRGRYAYIMSDGVLRRVEYIANNNGFHVLQDNADTSRSQERIKRSVRPDQLRTRMTTLIDSSSLMDNSMVNPNVYNMMGRDMSHNMMQRHKMNQMSSQGHMYGMLDRSSNMMDKTMRDQHMMDRNRIDQNLMGRKRMGENLIGRNRIDENMLGQKVMDENMMGRNKMYSNVMGQDMSTNRNLIGQDNMRTRNMMTQEMRQENMMGRDTMGNNVYSNMMAQDVVNRNMMGQEISPNFIGRDMSSNMMNAYDINRLPLGQRNTVTQRMQIEQIPQSVASRNTLF